MAKLIKGENSTLYYIDLVREWDQKAAKEMLPVLRLHTGEQLLMSGGKIGPINSREVGSFLAQVINDRGNNYRVFAPKTPAPLSDVEIRNRFERVSNPNRKK